MIAAEVIVVLGAALERDGRLGAALAVRVDRGVGAFHEGLAPWLLVTGRGEAEAMRRAAVAAGVPVERIIVEPRARNTRENAVETAALMRRYRLRRAILVTQPYHMPRALGAFRRCGVEVTPLETELDGSTYGKLREIVATLLYWALGWQA